MTVHKKELKEKEYSAFLFHLLKYLYIKEQRNVVILPLFLEMCALPKLQLARVMLGLNFLMTTGNRDQSW